MHRPPLHGAETWSEEDVWLGCKLELPLRSRALDQSMKHPFYLHFYILFAVSSVILSLRLTFKQHYSEDHRQAQAMAADARSRDIQARWRHLSYVTTARPEFGQEFLRKIDWSSLGLSEVQRSSLERRLAELLEYLRSPTIDAYVKLRTEGLTYELKPSPRAHKILTAAFTPPTSENRDPGQAQERLKILWRAIHTEGAVIRPPTITAVCLDRIAVAVTKTNSGWDLLSGKVAKGLTVGEMGVET